jgi:hypothetical protein
VEAVLRSPIRDKNNAELAPAGARLHARLVGMEQHSGFYFRISLQFESIELKGVAVPLRATAVNQHFLRRRLWLPTKQMITGVSLCYG